MLIDKWIEKGFSLIDRKDKKYFFKCPSGHLTSIWKPRLNKPYCKICENKVQKQYMLDRRKDKFQANGWCEVDIKDTKAFLLCPNGHSTTRTLFKTSSCVECKIQKKFEIDTVEMKALALKYGLNILSFFKKNPRNTSSLKVSCVHGHIRTYTFSRFRYLDIPCIACERESSIL